MRVAAPRRPHRQSGRGRSWLDGCAEAQAGRRFASCDGRSPLGERPVLPDPVDRYWPRWVRLGPMRRPIPGGRRHGSLGVRDMLPDVPRRRCAPRRGLPARRDRSPRRHRRRRPLRWHRSRRGRRGDRGRVGLCIHRRRGGRRLCGHRGRRWRRRWSRIRRGRARRRGWRRHVRRRSGLRVRCGRGTTARRRRRVPRRQERERVHVSLRIGGDADPKMDVWLVELGCPARADRADSGPFTDVRAFRDRHRAEMHERDGVAVGGLDRHGLPARRHRAGKRHSPARGGQNVRAGWTGDVDPAVLAACVRIGRVERKSAQDST